MDENREYVECPVHGKQHATYVCQHIVQSLRDGVPRGFWSAEGEPGELRPDSWCDACEEKLNSTGGEWNDESEQFAGVTLLCGACYDRAKSMNQGN